MNSNANTQVADGENNVKKEYSQYIVVGLGKEDYGIDIRYIENIVRMPHVTRVPKMPDYLVGVINLRGEVLPVVSLRRRMGLEADTYGKATRVIILKSDQAEKQGFVVDCVREVVTLESRQIDKVERDSLSEDKAYVTSIGKRENGDLISILDLNCVTIEEGMQ